MQSSTMDVDMKKTVIILQPLTFNDCNPVQWVYVDMILTSFMILHHETFNDCNPVQWLDIDMILASVKWR